MNSKFRGTPKEHHFNKIINFLMLESLCEQTGKELFPNVIDIFNREFKQNISKLDEALHAQDIVMVRFVATKMKASAVNIGAENLSLCCDYFERVSDFSFLSDYAWPFEMLKSEYQRVYNELENYRRSLKI